MTDDASPDAPALPATPIMCATPKGAEIVGALTTGAGAIVSFGIAQPALQRASSDSPNMLVLRSGTAHLALLLPAVDPPPAVGSSMPEASVGTPDGGFNSRAELVVDANEWPADVAQRCFAGRFVVTFVSGTLAGWFRVP